MSYYGYGEWNRGQFFNYKRKEKALQETISDLRQEQDDLQEFEELVKAWLDKLKQAWLGKNLERIATLFAKTTQYFPKPNSQPQENLEQIMSQWSQIKNQTIISLSFKILATQKRSRRGKAVVELVLKLANPNLNRYGIYEIDFKGSDCVSFRQWLQDEAD